MKKKIIFPLIVIAVTALFFIPVHQQESVLIKSSFLNTYSLLVNPDKWERWRPDLRKSMSTGSNKISIKKDNGSFIISSKNNELAVTFKGNTFEVHDHYKGSKESYRYIIIPVADKFLNKTIVIVDSKTNPINYLIEKYKAAPLAYTHIGELKNFMETDSLRYGFKIFKTEVPENTLIVMQKEVSEKINLLKQLKYLLRCSNLSN